MGSDVVAVFNTYSKKEIIDGIRYALEQWGCDQYFDDREMIKKLTPLVAAKLSEGAK
jgi:hypothetical protein